ncbi:uncharacterized protein LOC126767162 [Bactrocera neohumeralis]|uniref:uncharacterized protein LOC126767162 n=1 Tax=Bactrocera neohumeralis TaxID=98809 RepID=UPI002165EF99|nr:uncharacterized protein LOC126767162 [Bactrocera neohumeralis]
MSLSPQTPLSSTPAPEGAEKAVRALTLFETLRTSLEADRLHMQPVVVATSSPTTTAAATKKGRARHGAPTVAAAAAGWTDGTAAAEDPEKQLLRRQLQHAEELVKKLHDKNTALRRSLQQLEEAEADSRAQLTAKTASVAQQERQQQQVMAQLRSKVKELSAALAEQQQQRRLDQAEAPPAPPAAATATAAAGSSQNQSVRILALESELGALAHRVKLCEAQRDRLAEVQLASVLLAPVPPPSQGQPGAALDAAKQSAQEARIAKLVNGEVRKLFAAMRLQLVEEATLREVERSRRNELLFLQERQKDADGGDL